MLHLIFYLSCLCISFPAFAQGYFSIDNRTRSKDLSYPIFSNGHDSTTSRKINEFLGLSELAILPQHYKNIFEEITKDGAMGGLYGRKVIINYRIHSNSSELLSLQIYSAADGMTMHYWTNFYTFNAQNGDRIDIQDLFSQTGWKQFKKLARKKRIKAFSPFRKEWAINSDEELYHTYLSQDFDDYYIIDSTIFHNGINIFPKGSETDLITEFKYSEIKTMLNSYGHAIFEGGTDSLAHFRSNLRPQLMKGMIGEQYPITFILAKGFTSDANDYAEISAVYAYDRYGKGVSLEVGFPKHDHVTMREFSTDKNQDSCEITFSFTQTSLKGYWINRSKNKRLSLWAKKE
ncbi:MAG TPA: hypothetical protein VFO76_08655 [Candidatus Kapabacteria bacterium]|nr:hypothetical protein [Candidatus Kapabacteria bacterium]